MPRANFADAKTVTVAEVYGKGVPELSGALTGRQQFTDFRTNVTVGEMFLALDGTVKTHKKATHQFGGPRLIVAEQRRRIVTYTETGEMRTATDADMWMDDDGNICTHATNATVPIVKREVTYVAE